MRAKWYLRLAVVMLIAVSAWAVVPSGWTLITSTTLDQTGCTQSTTSGICLVQPTPTTLQVWAWANAGSLIEIYPTTGTAPVTSVFNRTGPVVAQTGDYAFTQISGTLTAAQMPATSTCTVTFTGMTQNGSGGGSFTGVNSSCK